MMMLRLVETEKVGKSVRYAKLHALRRDDDDMQRKARKFIVSGQGKLKWMRKRKI